MATEGYMVNNGPNQLPYRMPSSQAISPMSQVNNPMETDATTFSNLPIGSERASGRPDVDSKVTILIRKLPRYATSETLRVMTLFTRDLDRMELVSTNLPGDQGYPSAIAVFHNAAAAEEAKSRLHGKQNDPNEPPIQVDILRDSPGTGAGSRRNHFDMAANRANSGSSTASSTGQPRQASRFNGTFQAMDRISPPNGGQGFPSGGPLSSNEGPDVVSPISNFFSPQSPLGQTKCDRQRISGKSVIGEDGIDDEPAELLKDPVAYAKSDMSGQLSRHNTNSQLPTSRFANLSLSTSKATSPPMSGFTSPRTAAPMQSPTSAMSPTNISNVGPNAPYQLAGQHYQRHAYPPVNPADQNPPCNTLYVGNLPIDTSEDELKAMFSKQRGYKRLCFRTKQNGPMCFVEFEDISFATKALNELYGHPLHNSVKGGIRLSFSKNPLGVRTGQPGGMGPPTPLSPSGPMPGANGLGIQPFSTANGPPPGLAAPPGLNNSNVGSVNGMISPASMTGTFAMSDMGMGMSGLRSPQATGWSGQGGQYSDYMFGR
ncbi:cell cycle RNA binding protein whi3 [Mycoblastus sanguinarius]|nr:cell cycle RNA binding protein whi3 [Mycoblastus sanguinarius]